MAEFQERALSRLGDPWVAVWTGRSAQQQQQPGEKAYRGLVILIVIIVIIMMVMPTHLMKRGVEMWRNGGLVKRLRGSRRERGEGKWGRYAWQGQGQPRKREKTAVLPEKLQLQVELEILRCDRRQAGRLMMQAPLQVKSLLFMIAVNLGVPVDRLCATIFLTRLDLHAAQGFRQDGGRFSARPGYT